MSDATDFPFGENEVPAEAPAQETAAVAEVAVPEKKQRKAPAKKSTKSNKKASTPKTVATPKTAAKKQPAKKAQAKKATSKPAKKAESNGQRGRTSQYAGKKIFKVSKENPRREGTHGHKSFSVIKDGMTYEQYIQKGGRQIDLDWDVKKGNIKVK